eukprot:GHVN01074831.1.p1 GENE.GHVN01074831.1~~GHVN01074831.1.p1  ORF type:complete len:118 (-),score=34.73 GHVN01074831.1:89-442(-)
MGSYYSPTAAMTRMGSGGGERSGMGFVEGGVQSKRLFGTVRGGTGRPGQQRGVYHSGMQVQGGVEGPTGAQWSRLSLEESAVLGATSGYNEDKTELVVCCKSTNVVRVEKATGNVVC